MEWQEKITKTDYRCAKCRNARAIVRKVNIPPGSLPELLIRGGGRYRFVTCALCGYTEVYDLSVVANARQTVSQNDESVNLAPET